MCRADPDPPRSDGLLCRTVGVAIRTRTTHRHRISHHHQQHLVTFGRKADMNQVLWRNTFFSVNRLTMSPVQRLRTAAFVVIVTWLGLGSPAEAHSEHAQEHPHHFHRVYSPVKRRVLVAPSRGIVRIRPYQDRNSFSVRLGFNL